MLDGVVSKQMRLELVTGLHGARGRNLSDIIIDNHNVLGVFYLSCMDGC